MRSRTFFYVSCIVAVVSVCLWALYGYLAWKLEEERASYASRQAEALLVGDREKAAAQLRTLMRETKPQRDTLEAFASTDVLTAASTIEAAGGAAGVDIEIEGAAAGEIDNPQSAEYLSAVVIVANAEGSFEELLSTLRLLESLPFFSAIDSLQLTYAPGSGKSQNVWKMIARIRVITTLRIDS